MATARNIFGRLVAGRKRSRILPLGKGHLTGIQEDSIRMADIDPFRPCGIHYIKGRPVCPPSAKSTTAHRRRRSPEVSLWEVSRHFLEAGFSGVCRSTCPEGASLPAPAGRASRPCKPRVSCLSTSNQSSECKGLTWPAVSDARKAPCPKGLAHPSSQVHENRRPKLAACAVLKGVGYVTVLRVKPTAAMQWARRVEPVRRSHALARNTI